MSSKQTFRAPIEQAGGGGAFVTIPFAVERVFGKKRVPVRATIDGEPYRGLATRMGGDSHILIVLQEIREKIGKGAGDEVEVTLEEDTEPRVVELPADLEDALRHRPRAAAFFDSLSYTHRREYVRWIESAKREQTRRDRIGRALAMLEAGEKPR